MSGRLSFEMWSNVISSSHEICNFNSGKRIQMKNRNEFNMFTSHILYPDHWKVFAYIVELIDFFFYFYSFRKFLMTQVLHSSCNSFRHDIKNHTSQNSTRPNSTNMHRRLWKTLFFVRSTRNNTLEVTSTCGRWSITRTILILVYERISFSITFSKQICILSFLMLREERK